jgi:hypothetical protein
VRRYDHTVAQAVIRQSPKAEARVRARFSQCGTCYGQSGTGTGVSPSSSIFLVNIISPWHSILIHRLGDEQ